MDEILYLWPGEMSLWVFCMLSIFLFLLIGIKKFRRCCLIWWLIFSCQGIWFLYMIRFDIISVIFNCCLRFEFSLFYCATNSVVFTYLLNMIFKGCGKFRKMPLVFNNFWLILSFLILSIWFLLIVSVFIIWY